MHKQSRFGRFARTVVAFPFFVALIWIAVALLQPRPARGDSVVGSWSPVFSWPIVSIHGHILPNGKVLLWPRDGGNQARVWDPATGSFTQVPLPTMNTFCSGHSFLTDGRLLVTGGHIQDGVGEKKTHIFDYSNNSWTRVDDMNAGRWYPTTTSLANGEQLVVSGDDKHAVNRLPQVWRTTGGWRSLTGARMGMPLYPAMFLAPNGRVFFAGSTSRYLDTSGTGSWTTVANRRESGRDNYGSACMYEPGKVVFAGGGDPPSATAETIDLNAPSPAWTYTGSMASRRRQHMIVILPDGKVLAVGGTAGSGFNDACSPVRAAEMWDPVTGAWSAMASQSETRIYHSIAILLPDGRVLSAGGGQPAGQNCPDADHYTAEFYSPPYLFKGARPSITSAPGNAGYGQTIFVQTPDAASIAQVTLTRLSSATHSNNMNQRFNRLSFTAVSGGVNATTPSSANLCPPGHYLLWIVNGSGVPSTAKAIQII